MGHIISKYGIKPDPDKFTAVKTVPIPRNVHEMRRFLGLVGWYRRFIPNFSVIAAPLTNLTKKNVIFRVDEEAIEAINRLISNIS